MHALGEKVACAVRILNGIVENALSMLRKVAFFTIDERSFLPGRIQGVLRSQHREDARIRKLIGEALGQYFALGHIISLGRVVQNMYYCRVLGIAMGRVVQNTYDCIVFSRHSHCKRKVPVLCNEEAFGSRGVLSIVTGRRWFSTPGVFFHSQR